MRKIIAVIDEDGAVNITVQEGFKGEQCAGELEKILKELEAEGLVIKSKSVVKKASLSESVRQSVSA